MRTWTLLATGLLTAALLIPGTAAQAPGVTISFEDPTAPLPFDGTSELNFTATVGCLGIISSGGSTDLVVSTDGAPDYLGIADKTISFDQTTCISDGSGIVTVSDSLSVTPTSAAPGMSTMEVTIQAAHGDETASDTVPVTIGYKKGYTWSTDLSFPYEMMEDSVTFNLTVNVDTNAPTMVMFEVTQAPMGILPAPFPYTFNDPMATSTHVLEVTYQAPVGDWTNDTASIRTWSHYLNDGSMKTDDETMMFSFTRAAGAAGSTDDDKDSPGFGMVGALALLGAAMVAARRRN